MGLSELNSKFGLSGVSRFFLLCVALACVKDFARKISNGKIYTFTSKINESAKRINLSSRERDQSHDPTKTTTTINRGEQIQLAIEMNPIK